MPRGNPTCPRGQPLSGRHARIPVELICAFSKLDAGQASVFMTIMSHADSNGRNAYPSLRTIAEIAGLQESSVSEALKRLKRNGWIDWTSGGGKGKPNRYSFPFFEEHNTKEGLSTNSPVHDRGVSSSDNSPVQYRGVSAQTNAPVSVSKASGPDTQTLRKTHTNTPAQDRGQTERTEGTFNNTESVVDGSTSNGCEDLTAEKVRLLIKHGVSEMGARRLAADFSLPRIRVVTDKAEDQETGPGWIFKALKEEWDIEQGKSKPGWDTDAHQKNISEAKDWFEKLSPEAKSHVWGQVRSRCPSANHTKSDDEAGIKIFWDGVVMGLREGWFSDSGDRIRN